MNIERCYTVCTNKVKIQESKLLLARLIYSKSDKEMKLAPFEIGNKSKNDLSGDQEVNFILWIIIETKS